MPSMNDIFDLAMETAGSSKTATVSRKPRRSIGPSNEASAGPALSEVFMGVSGDIRGSHDPTQRFESDEKALVKAGLQQSRSRGHRSSTERAVLKKGQNAVLSVSKTESVGNTMSTHVGDLPVRETASVARQSLTSSASRVRPSKQPASRSVRPCGVIPPQQGMSGATNSNNNDNEDDEPILEAAHAPGMLTSSQHGRGNAEWQVRYGVNQAGQLPSRSRRYLNISAGSDRSSVDLCDQVVEELSSADGLLSDRPPSRQRHAFPTHLLDARDFFSPAKPFDNSTQSAPITITPWHNDEDEDTRVEDEGTHSPACSSPENREEDEDTTTHAHRNLPRQRPPSRYMTKGPRRGSSSSSISSNSTDDSQTNGRLPSRRGVAGSWNQGAQHHHDPKTDGFADVDESVPPPFRVEITTNSYHSQYIPADHRRADEDRRHSLKSRRASSFGSRAQLNNLHASLYDTVASADQCKSSRTMDEDPQWYAQDYEADTDSSGKRPAGGQVVRGPGPIPRYGLTRSVVQPSGIVDNNFPHHANSSMASTQWFRANNNPFFVSHAGSSTNDYEDMDAETAIANTPLFSGEEDLMAMTQLSDLCLDDFMGDTMYTSASTTLPNAQHTAPPAAALNTSLGRDFLSLFAQH